MPELSSPVAALTHASSLQVRVQFTSPQAVYEMAETFRYLYAAYYLMFSKLYTGKKLVGMFDLETVLQKGLITKEEKRILGKHKSNEWFKCIAMCFEHVAQVSTWYRHHAMHFCHALFT